MNLTLESVESLKSRIFVDKDEALVSDLYNALCELEERIRADKKPLNMKAYDLHMEIMKMESWCYGDTECGWCAVRGMCDAAQKLRDAIEKYDDEQKKKKEQEKAKNV